MLTLSGVRKPYPWGSVTSIPAILGVEPDGEPWAELWYGTHPAGPAQLPDGTTLDSHVSYPSHILGDATHDQFGGRLPYLIKLLAASRPLSIQVHPDRRQAEAGFAWEDAAGIDRDAPDRNYRDDWPKPELIWAIEPFDALCGFRDPEAAARDLELLGVPTLGPTIDALRSRGTDADRVRAGFLQLTGLGRDDARHVVAEAAREARGVSTATASLLGQLNDEYPGDVGVLVATLLNHLALRPGEALFLDAGTVHAYLRGTGVEVMANSDNVLRGGLTGKHIDVAELARIVNFTPRLPKFVASQPIAPGVERFETPAPEFTLYRVEPRLARTIPADGVARIVLALDDEVRVGNQTLTPGRAAFVGAHETDVALSGDGICLIAAPDL